MTDRQVAQAARLTASLKRLQSVALGPMTAKEFRAAVKALGWKQTVLAARLGVSPRTIRAWAQGTRPVPKMAAIVLRMWLGKD